MNLVLTLCREFCFCSELLLEYGKEYTDLYAASPTWWPPFTH
jgi:hypothetical protein